MSRGPESTHWCWTVFDYTCIICELPEDCTYIIYQEEAAPDTGRPHLQGYVQFATKKRGTTVTALLRNWFEPQVHPDNPNQEGEASVRSSPANGSDVENELYCSKEDSRIGGPYRFGVRKSHAGKRGGRSDLLDIQVKLRAQIPMSEVREDHFGSWVRYGKALTEYKRMLTPPRNFKSRVFLFVGPPGKGKSTLMKLIASQIGAIYKVRAKKGSGLYFDDYDGEPVMIIDEFDGDRMRPVFFNELCDEHEFVLPVHGGAGHQMVSRFVFIGSNYAPQFWWKSRKALQLMQTTRRIDIVFKVGFEPPIQRSINLSLSSFSSLLRLN